MYPWRLDPPRHQTIPCPVFGRGSRSRLCVLVGVRETGWTHVLTDARARLWHRVSLVILSVVVVEGAYIRPPTQVTVQLWRVCICDVSRVRQVPDGQLRKALWGAKIAKSPPTVSYADAMDSEDKGLHKWLSNIVGRTWDDSGLITADECRTGLDFASFLGFPPRQKRPKSCRSGLGSFARRNVSRPPFLGGCAIECRLQTASFGNLQQTFPKATRRIPRWHLGRTPTTRTLFVGVVSGQCGD